MVKKHAKNRDVFSGGYITLVELLVVISIIIILSIIVIPNLEQGERRQFVRSAALQLVQDFRDMQERAISSRELPGSNDCGTLSNPENLVVPPRYGVYFDIRNNRLGDYRYRMFADCNDDGNSRSTTSEAAESELLSSDGVTPFERLLPAGVVINEMRQTDEFGVITGGPRNRLFITYAPPDPTVIITRNNDNNAEPQGWIRLALTGTNCTNKPQDCLTVWVSQTGSVFIQ